MLMPTQGEDAKLDSNCSTHSNKDQDFLDGGKINVDDGKINASDVQERVFDADDQDITSETFSEYESTFQDVGAGCKLDLSGRNINDPTLSCILSTYAKRLLYLDVSRTPVTEDGLARLCVCTQLEVLKIDECSNIKDRDKANSNIAKALETMRYLSNWSCSKTPLSGRIFYKGKEFTVVDPVGEYVSVESYDNSSPIVRDDNPPRRFHREKDSYYYVKTEYSSETNSFTRFYAELDWMSNLVDVNMSYSQISGDGLSALCAAAGSRLRSLIVSHCSSIDDTGLYAIAQLCTGLEQIDLSVCSGITIHGVLYLANRKREHIQKLKLLDICNRHISPKIGKALLCEIEDLGFEGILRYCSDDEMLTEVLGKGEDSSSLEKLNLGNKEVLVFDATGEDITKGVCKVFDRASHRHFAETTCYAVNLSGRCITDRALAHILTPEVAPQIAELNLDDTFITEKGLGLLIHCRNLRILHFSRCWNILDKQLANQSVMPSITQMLDLQELYVSDTRISGRMLSEHRCLGLTALHASRAPFSIHALRMLANYCSASMTELVLSGCSFINSESIHYILDFKKLVYLDLSYCTGIFASDLSTLCQFKPEYSRRLKRIDISGIRGADASCAQRLASTLYLKCGHVVEVVMSRFDEGESSVFRGEFSGDKCVYNNLNTRDVWKFVHTGGPGGHGGPGYPVGHMGFPLNGPITSLSLDSEQTSVTSKPRIDRVWSAPLDYPHRNNTPGFPPTAFIHPRPTLQQPQSHAWNGASLAPGARGHVPDPRGPTAHLNGPTPHSNDPTPRLNGPTYPSGPPSYPSPGRFPLQNSPYPQLSHHNKIRPPTQVTSPMFPNQRVTTLSSAGRPGSLISHGDPMTYGTHGVPNQMVEATYIMHSTSDIGTPSHIETRSDASKKPTIQQQTITHTSFSGSTKSNFTMSTHANFVAQPDQLIAFRQEQKEFTPTANAQHVSQHFSQHVSQHVQPVAQPLSQSAGQHVSQPIAHPVAQSVAQPVSRPVQNDVSSSPTQEEKQEIVFKDSKLLKSGVVLKTRPFDFSKLGQRRKSPDEAEIAENIRKYREQMKKNKFGLG